ncbi:DUF928 domain-containing protein [Laspinema olomoucense]|uniref:DUF928 domain-containing protein n=1 Tax=Laspinema olomoucense TaxID=3231600 RepID=UPI0021BA8A87|nr:DUF928 domain-containing protein [Laspinema sp. D3a]MCT7988984.1 DUF928 domain-containing protein [Laspinema sp. D3a]
MVKRIAPLAVFLTLISWALVNGELLQPALSNPQSSSEEEESSGSFEDYDRPGQRSDRGSRGSCKPQNGIFFTALIPESNSARSVSRNPRLWFYIPESTNVSGEVGWKHEQDDDFKRDNFEFTTASGIVSLQIPPITDEQLTTNEIYDWYFKIYCNPEKSDHIYVNGSVRVVPMPTELNNQLEAGLALEWNDYKEHLLWFDTLTALAELRLEADTPNLQIHWENLLKKLGLENLAKFPINGDLGVIQNQAEFSHESE